MKKFLSLVLALIMTMSLVTISAGAKDFTDDSKITYEEAVDVMSALKVIDGYADGSFNPQGSLTRGAAAKIICNLILGPTTAAALSADTAPYKDVPVNHTFAGYIAYCQRQGIISGYADGTFRPAATLTNYAFLKMLLGALGYDSAIEGYVGDNWSIAVAKQALAIGLTKGMKTELNGTDYATREQACLYALNTLQATMVDYSTTVTANVNGAQVTVGNSVAKELDWDIASKTDGNIKDDDYVQFAEKYFTNLELEIGNGIYGRPANTWKLKKSEIGTYTSIDPTYVYTEETDSQDVYKDLGKTVCDEDEYDWTAFINGVEEDADDLELPKSKNDDAYKYTGDGAVTEIYIDVDRETVTVVEYNYYIGQVTKVKDETITVKPLSQEATILDVKTFEAEGYDEDDYVVFTIDFDEDEDDYIIGEVFEPKTVTGEVKRVQNDSASKKSYIKLADGEEYNYSESKTHNVYDLDNLITTVHPTLNKEYILYMDPNGFVLGFELAEDDVAQYLYVDDSDEELKDWVAKVYLPDGTKAKVDLKEKLKGTDKQTVAHVNGKDAAHEGLTPIGTTDAQGNFTAFSVGDKIKWVEDATYSKEGFTNVDNRIWKYSATDKGVYTLTWAKNVVLGYNAAGKYDAEIKNGKAYISQGENDLIVDKKTVFVDTVNENAYVGYNEVPSVENALLACVVGNDSIADVVFILEGNIYDSNATYFVLGKTDRESGDYDDEDLYWEFSKAYVNGENVKDFKVTYDAVNDLAKDLTKKNWSEGQINVVLPKDKDSGQRYPASGVLFKATKTIEDGQYVDTIELISREAVFSYDADGKITGFAQQNVYDADLTDYYGYVTNVAGDEAVGDGAFWIMNDEHKKVKFDTDDETVYVTVRKIVDKDGEISWDVSDGTIKDLKAIDPKKEDTATTYSHKTVHVVKRTNDETARLVYIFWTETANIDAKDIDFTIDTPANVDSIALNGTTVVGTTGYVAKSKDAKIVITAAANCEVTEVTVNGDVVKTSKKVVAGQNTYTFTIDEVKKDQVVEITTVNNTAPTATAVNVEATNAYVVYDSKGYADGSKITGLEKGNVIIFEVEAVAGTTDDKTTVKFNGVTLTANASGKYVAIVAEGENTVSVEVAPNVYTFDATSGTAGWTVKDISATEGVKGTTVTFKLVKDNASDWTASKHTVSIDGTPAAPTATVNGVTAAPAVGTRVPIADADAFKAVTDTLYTDSACTNVATAFIPGITTYYKVGTPAVEAVQAVYELSYTIGTSNANLTVTIV